MDALFEAVERHDLNRITRLLAEGSDPNACLPDQPGWSVLCAAVWELKRGGPAESVILLLRSGARTAEPLLVAVAGDATPGEFLPKEPALSLLLAGGADPNFFDDEGWSPLLVCVQQGDTQAAATLLRCGAARTINRPGGPAGTNALGLAVYQLNVEMVRLLLEAGADPLLDVDHQIARDHLYEALPGAREKSENPLAWDALVSLLPKRS